VASGTFEKGKTMEWDTGADGEVFLCPLTGYALETASKMAVLIRLEFLWETPDGEMEKGAVQLTLTPSQARALAGQIQKSADELSHR
jgi:hypothetical protein